MEMQNMTPAWLTTVAWLYLVAAVLSAAVLTYHIYGRKDGQRVLAMKPVWPISALFLGPVAILMYSRWGRERVASGPNDSSSPSRPSRIALVLVALLPGAAASAVAHLIGVPVVFGAGWTIAGLALWAVALFIAVLATALLFIFERVAAAEKGSRLNLGGMLLWSLATVLAFDIGMVGWMLYLHYNNAMQPITDVVFTFQMQIGTILGMVTAYPITAWLIRRRAASLSNDVSASSFVSSRD